MERQYSVFEIHGRSVGKSFIGPYLYLILIVGGAVGIFQRGEPDGRFGWTGDQHHVHRDERVDGIYLSQQRRALGRISRVDAPAGSGRADDLLWRDGGRESRFLWYNAPPAQVFMGDVGSLAIGGAMGTVAVLTKQEFMLLMVGGVFVIEALSVMLQVSVFKMTRRTTGTGRRLFKMTPLHHHFEMQDWKESKIVFRFLILAILFALLSLSTLKLRWGHSEPGNSEWQESFDNRRGASGIAAARFLLDQGAMLRLPIQKPIEKWTPEALALKESGVGLFPGEPPSWLLDQLDLVVVSPGVPANIIPIRYAERAGAEVIGEVELAHRYLKGRIVAITGSNGKTTTTSLIGELLRDAGLPVQVGGNIGKALISMVETSRDDGWTVAELSSFQLETIKTFHPSIAVVLNVTPNHMDRYETFNDYAAAKHRIFMNQTAEDSRGAQCGRSDSFVVGERLAREGVELQRQKELENGVFLRGRGADLSWTGAVER